MSTDDELLDRLATARADLERARERIGDVGERRLHELRDAHDRAMKLLGRYEDRATGSGDFQGYIEFQESIAALVEDLPEDLPRRDRFEAVDERMQQRRLSAEDFAAARETLEEAADLAERLDERRRAEDRLRSVTQAIRDRIFELGEEIDRLEVVRSLGDADLDAPIEELREPIETYNERVRRAFEDVRQEAPARTVLGLVETAERYPLIDFESAPGGLIEFVETAPVGEEPLSVLREYTEYSRSKLEHYVDEPATFQRVIGGNRTYLDRLDGEPLTISWPPPPAAELRWRAAELVAMLNRFAPESTIGALQQVREKARDEAAYERLRLTARATVELTETERERLADGAVEEDLAAARERVSTLRDALEDGELP